MNSHLIPRWLYDVCRAAPTDHRRWRGQAGSHLLPWARSVD